MIELASDKNLDHATGSCGQEHENLALVLLKLMGGVEALLEKLPEELREGNIHESSEVG